MTSRGNYGNYCLLSMFLHLLLVVTTYQISSFENITRGSTTPPPPPTSLEIFLKSPAQVGAQTLWINFRKWLPKQLISRN